MRYYNHTYDGDYQEVMGTEFCFGHMVAPMGRGLDERWFIMLSNESSECGALYGNYGEKLMLLECVRTYTSLSRMRYFLRFGVEILVVHPLVY